MFRSQYGRGVYSQSVLGQGNVTHSQARAFAASHSNIKRDSRYNALEESDVRDLTDIVGAGNALRDAFDVQPYNTDWMHKWSGNTGLVLRPDSTEQVSAILKYCNARSLAVVPQGGNTGLVGGSVPIHDEIVLSLSRMNKILDLNKVSGIVTVEAGVVLEQLMGYLSGEGFVVPLDQGAKGSCQLGGNVSTNAGGLRLMRYGSQHGSVQGIEVVLADGTVLDLQTAMRKDNTGIDLKHQFIGSEGSLGVVTKVALLAPSKPSSVKVQYLSQPSFEGVLAAMQLCKEYLCEILSACEYQDGQALAMTLRQLPQLRYPFEGELDTDKFFMVIETSGSNAQHDQEKLEMFLDSLSERIPGADGVQAENEKQASALWKLRESVAEGANKSGYVYKYDVSLPVERMDSFAREVRARLAPFGAQTIGYGHLGDGNLHINVVTTAKDDRVQHSLEPWLFSQLQAMKGSISAEHGLGQAKNEFIHYSKPAEAVHLMHGIKQLMDPKHILNPYKFLPCGKAE